MGTAFETALPQQGRECTPLLKAPLGIPIEVAPDLCFREEIRLNSSRRLRSTLRAVSVLGF